MIKSRTYNGQAGLNYIQNPDLAFATVYVVKREGIQYDKYVSGSTNRTYIYQNSIGRINFPTGFGSGGEKVFVIFKTSTGTEPETPPGVCEPVVIIDTEMPIALVGEPYSYTVLLSGSRPFTLSDLVAPSWMSGSVYILTQVRLFGTPDAESETTVTFNVTNGCGSDAFSRPLSVMSGTVNFFVGGRFFTARINSITGPDYILTSGSLPAPPGPVPIEGIHQAYTGTITVVVAGIVFPLVLRLEKNGVLLEIIPVPSNSTYVFASQSYLSTDEISIILTS